MQQSTSGAAPFPNPWLAVLRGKQQDLELIASWASIAGYGRVRDLCRQAKAELQWEIDRTEGR